MSSAPNFSLSASTSGSDQGSGTGPFGLGGAAGAAGFGGGGGTAAAGFGGVTAADSSFGLLVSSATTQLFQVKRDGTKPRDSNTSIATLSTAYHRRMSEVR